MWRLLVMWKVLFILAIIGLALYMLKQHRNNPPK
jgi:hypothetical protein